MKCRDRLNIELQEREITSTKSSDSINQLEAVGLPGVSAFGYRWVFFWNSECSTIYRWRMMMVGLERERCVLN